MLGIVLAIGAGVGCTSHPSSSANSSNVAANHSSVASASATSVPAPGASIPAEDPAVVTAIGPKLLQPDDVGLGGVVDWVGPVPSPSIDRIGCGVLNPQFSPSADLETGGAPNEAGVEQHKAAYGFFERVLVYADEATASHAVDAETARIVACLKPNTTPFAEPKDVSSVIGAAQAVEIDYGNPGSQVFIVRAENQVIEFEFLGRGQDPTRFPDAVAVVRVGVQRLSS